MGDVDCCCARRAVKGESGGRRGRTGRRPDYSDIWEIKGRGGVVLEVSRDAEVMMRGRQ